jgi:peptidoglycan-associated lipoprotein
MKKYFYISTIFLVFILACARAPIKELNEARDAIKDALNHDALVYAPTEYNSSEEAFHKATNLTALKNYTPAKKEAVNAKELAFLAKRIAMDKKALKEKERLEALKREEEARKALEQKPAEQEEVLGSSDISGEMEDVALIPGVGRLSTIYFDFDKSIVREDQKNALDENVDKLLKNKNVKILIEGHCDSRGTNEYNLALGIRRARAIESYFINSGIDKNRLEIASYGEERPVDLGETEEAYAKNRRAEFVVK